MYRANTIDISANHTSAIVGAIRFSSHKFLASIYEDCVQITGNFTFSATRPPINTNIINLDAIPALSGIDWRNRRLSQMNLVNANPEVTTTGSPANVTTQTGHVSGYIGYLLITSTGFLQFTGQFRRSAQVQAFGTEGGGRANATGGFFTASYYFYL